eukprot:462301-Amphidinium_carterae.1
MFLRKAPIPLEDDDGTDKNVENHSSEHWGPADFGLFRAMSNVHVREPWNRERLHLQLERAKVTAPPMPFKAAGLKWRQGGTLAGMLESELLTDEDREIMDCSLGAWQAARPDNGPVRSLRLRSHYTSQRSLLL